MTHASTSPVRRFEWLGRGVLLIGGTAFGLIFLEIALALVASQLGSRPVGLELREGRATVLCVGDSHTYGIHVPAEHAYPGQLESELARRRPGKFQVVNLGLPGMSSSQIRARLPEWIERYAPQVVILRAGINNVWNRSDLDADAERPSSWLERRRLYRLGRILASRVAAKRQEAVSPTAPSAVGAPSVATDALPERPELEVVVSTDNTTRAQRDRETGEVLVEHHGNPMAPRATEQAAALLERDLEQIHAMLEARGVRLVLLGYAARFERLEAMTRTMAELSTWRAGLPFVDPRPRFDELLAGVEHRAEYFLNEREGHPNARGYAEEARLLADVLASEVGELGGE